MVIYNSYVSKIRASHRPPFTFGTPAPNNHISRNITLASSSQYDTESEDSSSIPNKPFQSRPRFSWDIPAPAPAPATGLGSVRPQQQPQQQRPSYHPLRGPAVHDTWSSSPPRLHEPHAAASKDQTTRYQMWASALDDRKLGLPRPLVLAAKDEPQTIRDQMWATATLEHKLGPPEPLVVAAQTAPWSQIPQTRAQPPLPFPHLLKANYRAPYAQDQEYMYKQLFFDESALSSHGLVRRRAVKAAIDEWLVTSTVASSALGRSVHSSSTWLETSAASAASQEIPAKATSLVSCAKAVDLVSIVFAFVGLVVLYLRWVLNKVVNTLRVFVTWKVPGPPQNMMPRDQAGWSTVQSAPWEVPGPSQNMPRDSIGWSTVQSTPWK